MVKHRGSTQIQLLFLIYSPSTKRDKNHLALTTKLILKTSYLLIKNPKKHITYVDSSVAKTHHATGPRFGKKLNMVVN